jgi:hypothetical protein
VTGVAEAEAETAKMAVYAGASPHILLALALRDLAGQLPSIGTVNLSPDLLSAALAQLADPNASRR